jgi:hypothetical protein
MINKETSKKATEMGKMEAKENEAEEEEKDGDGSER